MLNVKIISIKDDFFQKNIILFCMRLILQLIFVLIVALTPQSFAFGGKSSSANEGKGYVGTLPDLKGKFAVDDEAEIKKPVYEQTKNFNSANEIKPIPRDNPAFVNIILKTDKTSEYLNDINEIIPMFEGILASIEKDEDVQKFGAKVFFLNQTVNYLEDKYSTKPEQRYISFKKMTAASAMCRAVLNLRSEAEKNKYYMSFTDENAIFSKNSINTQLGYLKSELESTISVLKEVK